ncbi:uncharacterized protein C20orf204 homolog [Perognathus longimembris pacificus]|uniref:uncharacterized protein C20orf204 homolog n=1 Tax=Perognathus longimembris pacificus TaxID=214514 RepID=UPI002019E8DA|nr:uncharacterized protein C20orf204 homolog [Perognathus longimembris pacificus]
MPLVSKVGGAVEKSLEPILIWYSLQVSPKSAFCVLLLALLRTTLGGARPGSCSIPEMLHHYQAIIFQDLQAALRLRLPTLRAPQRGPGSRHYAFIQKNLTGAGGGLGLSGASCAAQKERTILLSIESLAWTLRGAVADGRGGPLEKAAWTVAVRTEAVMRRHCWTSRQVGRRPRMRPAPARSRGGRRRLLMRALGTVATCWNKLFALGATVPRGH